MSYWARAAAWQRRKPCSSKEAFASSAPHLIKKDGAIIIFILIWRFCYHMGGNAIEKTQVQKQYTGEHSRFY